MTATLADYWPTLCPALPPAWDTPVNRRNLAELTQRLAPVPRVALECRLEDFVAAILAGRGPACSLGCDVGLALAGVHETWSCFESEWEKPWYARRRHRGLGRLGWGGARL